MLPKITQGARGRCQANESEAGSEKAAIIVRHALGEQNIKSHFCTE